VRIVEVSVIKNAEVRRMIEKNALRARTGIRKAFYKMGRQMSAIAKEDISTGVKTGRVYYYHPTVFGVKQTKNGKRNFNIKIAHRSSAPGESPAKITGALMKSISYSVRGAKHLEYGANGIPIKGNHGITVSKYPLFLEEGYQTNNKTLLPRPALKNSIDKNSINNTNHLQREIFKAIIRG